MAFTGLDNLIVPESGEEGYFIVGLVDILGQSKQLLSYDDPPPTGLQDREKLQKLRSETLSRIRQFRRDFHDQFLIYEETIERSPLNCIGGPIGAFVDSLGSEPIGVHSFSDLIALSLPLKSSKKTVPMEGVFLMIATFGMAGLLALYRGHPVRGGIELDVGWPISHEGAPNEIYGPALAKAYYLESRVAEYPRIVVGRNLYDFILLNTKLKASNDPNRTYANLTHSLLVVDDDKRTVINPYSDWYRNGKLRAKHRHVTQRCLAFTSGELEKFKSSGHEKLTARYARLEAFIQRYGLA